jgi:hypothetical protein
MRTGTYVSSHLGFYCVHGKCIRLGLNLKQAVFAVKTYRRIPASVKGDLYIIVRESCTWFNPPKKGN